MLIDKDTAEVIKNLKVDYHMFTDINMTLEKRRKANV